MQTAREEDSEKEETNNMKSQTFSYLLFEGKNSNEAAKETSYPE